MAKPKKNTKPEPNPLKWLLIAFGLVWFLSLGVGPQTQYRQQGNATRQVPTVTQHNQPFGYHGSQQTRRAQQIVGGRPCKMAPTGPEREYSLSDYTKGWGQTMRAEARNITPGGCEVKAATNTWAPVPGGFPVRGGYASRGAVPASRTPSYYGW